MKRLSEFDVRVMRAVALRRKPAFTAFLRILTRTGNGVTYWIVAGTLLLLSYAQVFILPRQYGLLRAMLCALIAFGLGRYLKKWAARKRPFQSMEDSSPLIGTPLDDSFPSSHTAGACALFVGLLWLGHPFAPFFGVWAALVSFSRIYLGVHYPTDLAGGAVLGLICGTLVLPIDHFFQIWFGTAP